MTSNVKYNKEYAWRLAKKITVFIVVVLFLEMLYFLKTASSSFEITMICIFLFGLISNASILYNLYQSTD